jgi:hypothetical protein
MRRRRAGCGARSSLVGESRPELRAALEAAQAAALAAAAHGEGLRVARTGYVDELADAARTLGASADALQQRGAELSASLSGEALDPAEPLARAVWEVLERIAAAGAPEHFGEALGDAAPAISAFAEDVLAHYRARLDQEGGVESGFEGRTTLITGGGTGGDGRSPSWHSAGADRSLRRRGADRGREPAARTAWALATQVDVRDPERGRLGGRGGRCARTPEGADQQRRRQLPGPGDRPLAERLAGRHRHRPERDVLLLERGREEHAAGGRRWGDAERDRRVRLDGEPDDSAFGGGEGRRLEPALAGRGRAPLGIRVNSPRGRSTRGCG